MKSIIIKYNFSQFNTDDVNLAIVTKERLCVKNIGKFVELIKNRRVESNFILFSKFSSQFFLIKSQCTRYVVVTATMMSGRVSIQLIQLYISII